MINIGEHQIDAMRKAETIIKAAIACIIFTLFLIVFCQPVTADEVMFNASVDGSRNIGQEYTFTLKNASGTADAVYHYTVYDYRLLGSQYTYWSESWGRWYVEPAGRGRTWIAVWVRGWLEGTAYHGYDQDRFSLWIWGNTSVSPVPVHMQDVEVGKRGSGKYMPAVIREIEDRYRPEERSQLITDRYGWKDEIQMNRMMPGRSNAFDGYILYSVPDTAVPEDIAVAGWFGYHGLPVWHLTTRSIVQKNLEREILRVQADVKEQIETGQRVREQPPVKREAA